MRHEINSLNTKTELAESLKQLINQNHMSSKITVNDITKNCSVNRNTFYYHFNDIQSLIFWILDHDIYSYIRSLGDIEKGEHIREFIISYLRDNQKFLNYAYQYLGLNVFWNSCIKELYLIIIDYIHLLEKQRKWNLDPAIVKFVAELYAEQVTSIYLMQFHQPDKYHKETALKCLKTIFDYSIPDLLIHENQI